MILLDRYNANITDALALVRQADEYIKKGQYSDARGVLWQANLSFDAANNNLVDLEKAKNAALNHSNVTGTKQA